MAQDTYTDMNTRTPDTHLPTRTEWKIFVTPAQRADITAAARQARVPIGVFVHDCVTRGQRAARTDWARGVQRLDAALGQIQALAAQLTAQVSPPDTRAILGALISLEREIHRLGKPWMAPSGDPAASEKDPSAPRKAAEDTPC